MNNLLVICGPTATGKTGLGIKLSRKFNGEIISADSRQVYRRMDIGTGKDISSAKFQFPNSNFQTIYKIKNHKFQTGYYLLQGVKIWLYDLVKPDFKFSVADYVECAQKVIKDIWRRGKLPIVVGGTGFYIKGLTSGIKTVGIEPDWELRKKLSNLEIEKLREELAKVNPDKLARMNESDRNNPRRLIRAIEIAINSKKRKPKDTPGVCVDTLPVWSNRRRNVFTIGLKTNFQELYRRIDRRVEQRIDQGIEKEIKSLLDLGYSWESSVLGATIGYQEWQPLLGSKKYEGRSKKDEVRRTRMRAEIIQGWKYAEHAYARRQMTWFKKQSGIRWFDISTKDWQLSVEQLVKQWYDEND